MADAVGVASSVAAFITNILTLINYVKDVYNAPNEISQFLKELKYLRIYLSAVDELIPRSTEDGQWLKTLKQLDEDSVFKELMKLLEELDKKLCVSPPQWKIVKKRLMWTLTKTSVEEVLKKIERLKTLIMSAVQLDHLTLSHAMIADVKGTVDVVLIADDKPEEETDITADVCAKYMHDEDNTIGILVKDPQGCPWTLYGDKRALDRVNDDSGTRCVHSVQVSANEIYKAYQTQQAPSPPATKRGLSLLCWSLRTPSIKHWRRSLRGRNFKMDWWFWSTALECKTSGWWDYPIAINGQNIIPWSAVAVTTPGSEHLNGLWGGGPSKDPIFNAVLFTPLAVINFNGGKEISVRVYYLDEQYVLQEYCYSAHKGGWFSGELGDMKIQAATDMSIAAIQYGDECGGVYIRVYCQELASGAIKELCNDGYWFRGATLLVALSGSSIAAVVYSWNGLQLPGGSQVPGELDIGKAPGCVPISALGYVSSTEGPELHVYWRNLENQIVGTKYTDSWGSVNKVVGGLKPGTQFAATQWSNGMNLRLYYQAPYDSVLEMVNDGTSWEDGATVGEVY
ncbi:hypothetical protein ARMGADRAFT_1093487 [Armillaria gallica]|uniref:Uncharacterized protein n=1 Tax=Armillaria gallica TaxID=47427 RepID=A0A2H3CIQ7_ARMGA|nr:hypothetical protein ARMGADRAFT_1093487 [Armillaria gallica]